MSKSKKTNERTLQDQLRIQQLANKRATKLIEYLKKELEIADQEISEVYERVNFWVDYTAWLGNTSINVDGRQLTNEGLLPSLIDQLTEKERGLLSSIVLTMICSSQSLESIFYLLVENKSPSINEEYLLSDDKSIKLNMN